VLDWETQEPLSGVEVALSSGTGTKDTTDSTGQYHIPAIDEGEYELSFSKSGYIKRTVTISVFGADKQFNTEIVRKDEFGEWEAVFSGMTPTESGLTEKDIVLWAEGLNSASFSGDEIRLSPWGDGTSDFDEYRFCKKEGSTDYGITDWMKMYVYPNGSKTGIDQVKLILYDSTYNDASCTFPVSFTVLGFRYVTDDDFALSFRVNDSGVAPSSCSPSSCLPLATLSSINGDVYLVRGDPYGD